MHALIGHLQKIYMRDLPALFVGAVDGVNLACLLLLPEEGLEDDRAVFPVEGEVDNDGDKGILFAPSDPRLIDNFLAFSSSLVRIG